MIFLLAPIQILRFACLNHKIIHVDEVTAFSGRGCDELVELFSVDCDPFNAGAVDRRVLLYVILLCHEGKTSCSEILKSQDFRTGGPRHLTKYLQTQYGEKQKPPLCLNTKVASTKA
jgi:hypothetical protein